MKIKVGQSEARLFGRAGESVTRSDRRERELEFESPFPPLTARPNRRREGTRGLTTQSSPLGGAPNQHETGGKTLTPVGHPFMTPSERRFAPTTVRQARNGVRYGLEQVSAFIGIRIRVGRQPGPATGALTSGLKPIPLEVCGCSSMVELQPSKLATWVRFPSPAPNSSDPCN
jgi:hypothetical protein